MWPFNTEAAEAWVAAIIAAVGVVSSYVLSVFRTGQLESDVEEIKKQFLTANGEQRLVSAPVCRGIREDCQRLHDERQARVDARLEKHDEKLDAIIEGQARIEAKLSQQN